MLLLLLGFFLPIKNSCGTKSLLFNFCPNSICSEGDHLDFSFKLELNGVNNSIPSFGGIRFDGRNSLNLVDEYFFALSCSILEEVSQEAFFQASQFLVLNLDGLEIVLLGDDSHFLLNLSLLLGQNPFTYLCGAC
jgi:hypothetical protein